MDNNMNNGFQDERLEETEPLKAWDRLKFIFTDPKKAFLNLSVYPKVLFPILLIGIGMLLTTLISMDKATFIDQAIQQSEKLGTAAPDLSQMTATYYTSIVLAGVFPMVFWVFKSFMVNGLAALVGGNGSFKEAFSTIAHSYIPVLLGAAILGIIGRLFGIGPIAANLGLLLPKSMEGSFLYLALTQLDVFVIWYQILAIIGVSYVYGLSKQKASIAVLMPWAVWMLIISGLGSFANNMAKMM